MAALDEKYELAHQLGEGGFATVYLATSRADGAEVAVKKIYKETSNANAINNEIQFMKKIYEDSVYQGALCNKHLLPLLDHLEDSSSTYVVMPVCAGGDLLDLLGDEEHLSEDDTAKVAHALADALACLHASNLVHRDVKPDNLRFMSQKDGGSLKLIDYGCIFSVGSGPEDPEAITGTPEFMAPEALAHQIYTPAGDVFSLGVTVFSLLCGYLPFENETQTIFGKWDSSFSEEGWESISDQAKDFVTQCLEKDHAKRTTAAALLTHPWLLAAPAEAGGGSPQGLGRSKTFSVGHGGAPEAPRRPARKWSRVRRLRGVLRLVGRGARVRAGLPRLTSMLMKHGLQEEAIAAVLQDLHAACPAQGLDKATFLRTTTQTKLFPPTLEDIFATLDRAGTGVLPKEVLGAPPAPPS